MRRILLLPFRPFSASRCEPGSAPSCGQLGGNSWARKVGTALVCLLAGVPAAALAQHSHGYLFAAPGGATARVLSDRRETVTTLHLGAGGEGIIGKGIGIGGELGALAPTEGLEAVVGLFSLNGYYHFFRHGNKADPFVTAGYTLAFRGETANLFNFGGGVNYWFISRLGLKVEIRDHVWTPPGVTVHAWGVRFGLAFR